MLATQTLYPIHLQFPLISGARLGVKVGLARNSCRTVFSNVIWITYKDIKQKIKTNFIEMRMKWLDLIQNHFQRQTFVLASSINKGIKRVINIPNISDVGVAKDTLY